MFWGNFFTSGFHENSVSLFMCGLFWILKIPGAFSEARERRGTHQEIPD
jgi:hypothetical protein